MVTDRTTSIAQQEFLNRIMGVAQDDPESVANTDSLPAESTDDTQPTIRRHRPGLGRAVILNSLPKEDETADLRELVAFLWRIRNDRSSTFRTTGTLNVPPKPVSQETGWPSEWSGGLANPYEPYRPFKPIRLTEAEGLTTILLPESVTGIPFVVVVVILLLFLIAIVPLDYFLLGHFNRRRYTWVLLPVVSLGNSYLGSADYRTSLEFVDLTTNNRVVRSSRFELLFTAKQREVATELKQTLHTVIAERQADIEEDWNSAAGMAETGGEQPRKPELPVYEGNLPGSFTVQQPMRQWSPHLSRQSSFQTERQVPPFELDDSDFKLPDSPALLANPEWQRELRNRIPLSESESTVLLFHRKEVFELTREATPGSGAAPEGPPDSKDERLLELIRKVCVRPAGGLFSFVSQISPNGAADFEDLAILDPSDPNQWLLVVLKAQGDDYVVFRRLFRGVF